VTTSFSRRTCSVELVEVRFELYVK